jgi:hypothetical protein
MFNHQKIVSVKSQTTLFVTTWKYDSLYTEILKDIKVTGTALFIPDAASCTPEGPVELAVWSKI